MKKLYLLIFAVLGIVSGVCGQKPKSPYILQAETDPSTGWSKIYWLPSISIETDAYIIHRGNGIDINIVVDTIDYTNTEYTWHDQLGKTESLAFTVSALDSTDGRDLESMLPSHHHTIFLQKELNECNSRVELIWTGYIGWGDSLNTYSIIRDGVEIDSTQAGDTTYFDTNIKTDSVYSYHIRANHLTGRSSTSNELSVKTDMKNPPHSIYTLQSSMDNSTVELEFLIGPGSELKQYYLLRAETPNGNYDTILRPVFNGEGRLILEDNPPEQKAYYYKLASVNDCDRVLLYSNIGSSIFLGATNQGYFNQLNWNLYKEWDEGVSSYEIQRKAGNESTFETVGNTEAGTTNYTDNIEQLAIEGAGGEYCYRIIALENNNNPLRETGNSISNTVCLYIDARLFMPNAFTPNDDGLNEIFTPVMNFLPKEYTFTIYDRRGRLIFNTTAPDTGWDGTFGGEKMPPGVYMYSVRAKAPDGKLFEKRGQVSLLYR